MAAAEQCTPRGNGQQVGRYHILSHIASGGMGGVYLAYDPVLDREVALKVLSPEMAAKPNMVQRFQREAKAASKLNHENIVNVFDFGEADGTLYLALEFVDGTDLQDYIDQRPGGRLDVDETVAIAIQAAKALDHAFAQGIVHRDIKPSNFLVTTKAGKLFVKLTDLGLAREAEDARITRDNTTLGTVDYIAPEQARDAGAADIRSDLYSLGCSIFHMLVGHGPFPKGTLVEKIQHHLLTPAPDVRNRRSDVSDHLSDVLYKLLAKNPAERYETPLHLLHDLMSPGEFEAYLATTRDLPRPEFTPPVHYARTVSPTVYLDPEDIPEPDPLFPDDFRFAEDTETELAASDTGSHPAPPPPPEEEAVSVELESVELEPLESGEMPAAKPPVPPKSATAMKTRPAAKSQRLMPKTKSRKAKPRPGAVQQRARRLEKRRMLRNPLWFGGIAGGLLFAAFGVWAMTSLFSGSSRPEPALPKIVDQVEKKSSVVAPVIAKQVDSQPR